MSRLDTSRLGSTCRLVSSCLVLSTLDISRLVPSRLDTSRLDTCRLVSTRLDTSRYVSSRLKHMSTRLEMLLKFKKNDS